MPHKGYKQTEEHKRKVADTHRGRPTPDLVRKKISESCKKNPARYWLGKHPSIETKQKLSTAKQINPTKFWLGKKQPQELITKRLRSYTRRIANGELYPGCYGRRGYFFSAKNGTTLYYMSSLELEHFQKLELDTLVMKYQRCPFTIKYYWDDKSEHYYIPDILVTYQNSRQAVVECKPMYALELKHNPEKFEAARLFCMARQLDFVVVTEQKVFSIFSPLC